MIKYSVTLLSAQTFTKFFDLVFDSVFLLARSATLPSAHTVESVLRLTRSAIHHQPISRLSFLIGSICHSFISPYSQVSSLIGSICYSTISSYSRLSFLIGSICHSFVQSIQVFDLRELLLRSAISSSSCEMDLLLAG